MVLLVSSQVVKTSICFGALINVSIFFLKLLKLQTLLLVLRFLKHYLVEKQLYLKLQYNLYIDFHL